ncbi:MAG: CheR family methyltransferase, partial [Flavitalea sp.]
ADFTYYKQTTIRRRILRRISIKKVTGLKEYYNLLTYNKQEQEALFHDLVIPVTAFFRDLTVFETIRKKVIPELFKLKNAGETVRIWVAGCSTGEEAYSLAILIAEALPVHLTTSSIQIFATDISDKVIRKARSGIYDRKDLAGVSDERLKKFFIFSAGHYQVKKSIREMCIFAVQNFLTDPPFAKLDLISCRNVLIYMEPYLQQKALSTFHYSLAEGGVLVLGNSETVGSSSPIFEDYYKADKIFKRIPGPGKFIPFATRRQENLLKLKAIGNIHRQGTNDVTQATTETLLARHGDIGVVINQHNEVVQFRGATGKFLQPAEGKASLNLIRMAREGLGFELHNLIQVAKETGGTSQKKGIVVENGNLLADIEVFPLAKTIDPYYFVLFKETDSSEVDADMRKVRAGEPGGDDELLNQYRARLDQLEKELSQTREDMKAITQDQEAANEDLQSTNEELLSGSEELQSLNEELETTKEEVQSSNEELMLLNQELFEKNEQVNRARNYAESIIETVYEPLLILTRQLNIKFASRNFFSLFGQEAGYVVGRSLFKIQNGIWNTAGLENALNDVFLKNQPIQNMELDIPDEVRGSRTFLLNAHEVITEEKTDGLLLVALFDITERKKLTERLKFEAQLVAKERRLLYDFFMDAPSILGIINADYSIEFSNTAFKLLFETISSSAGSYLSEVLTSFGLKDMFEEVLDKQKPLYAQEFKIVSAGNTGEERYIDLLLKPVTGGEESRKAVFLFAVDVTEKVRSRKLIEVQNTRIQDMIMQSPAFAATVDGPEHVIVLLNRTFTELFDSGTSTGIRFSEVLHISDRKSVIDKLDHVYRTGEIYRNNQLSFARKALSSGQTETIYTNISIQPLFGEDGGIIGLLILGYDITNQVLADKKVSDNLKLLLEASHQITWTAMPTGEFEIMNKRFYDYTGVDVDELSKNQWGSFIHADHLAANEALWKESLKSGADFFNEVLVLTAEGSYRWHVAKASAVVDPGGQVKNWVGILSDIHDQKLAAQMLETQVLARTKELRETNEKLNHSNDSLQQYASIASHDLQEPLRKIKTFTAILNRRFSKYMPEEGKEFIQKIKASSERMSLLVKEVLEYSKVLKGNSDFTKVNLQSVLDDVLGDLELLVSDNDAKIIREGDLPVISANHLQMNQLFTNLLTNALKFRQETVSPVITITARQTIDPGTNRQDLPHNGEYLEIVIRDNGIGFEQEYAEQIFQIFERLHSPEEFEGTGIGLALCSQIMFNHGGTITANAAVGEGAAFTLIFPLT